MVWPRPAIGRPLGGPDAAVVVSQVRNTDAPRLEVFRDDALACGHQWPSPGAALCDAIDQSQEVVKAAQGRLAG